ncbi:MAG: transcriptional regulator NrdR [Synechococcales cyanobacterium RM1_1_8]|nr:transcriptional regulator NrdR [Synechococcales cyanobacterium RM1_1_8]
MRCPACSHTISRVLESRSAEGGQSVRRRRECLHCSQRFTTYERIEFVPTRVIKRDGERESFDSSKLLRGIVRACEKTNVTPQQQKAIVSNIEAEIQQRSQREITSDELGEYVLEHLRSLSEVAYVRFASVYGKFQSIRDFVETLAELKSESEARGDRDYRALQGAGAWSSAAICSAQSSIQPSHQPSGLPSVLPP